MKKSRGFLALISALGLCVSVAAPQPADAFVKRIVGGIKRAASRVGRAARGVFNRGRRLARGAVKRARRLARGAVSRARRGLRGAVRWVKSRGRWVRQKVRTVGRSVAHKARNVAGKVVGAVKSLPGKALGLLRGIGGKLLGALKGVGGGLLEVLLKVKDVAMCVVKKGKLDLLKGFTQLTRSPGSFLKRIVGTVWNAVKDIGKALLGNRAGGLSTILGAATGGVVSEKTLRTAMDWIWSRFEKVGRKLGSIGCLVKFLRPFKNKLRGPVTWLVRFLLDKYRWLYNKQIKPRLLPLAARVLDKVVTAVIGKKWTDRVKYILMRAFEGEARARKLEKQEKLRVFLTALANRSSNLKSRWLDARAVIAGSTDFGIRKLLFIAKESFKVLGELVYEKVISQLIDYVQQGIFSTIANVLAKVVNGLCGLIPEVGGIICAIITGIVVAAYDWVLVKVLKVLISEGLRTVILGVFNKVTDVVANAIQKPIVNKVDSLIARNSVVGGLANVLNPFISMFFDVVGQWAKGAGTRLPKTYSVGGCHRGVCGVSSAAGSAPAAAASPEAAYSARVVEMGDRLVDLATSGK